MNNRDFSRAVRKGHSRRRWQSENKHFIWFVRCLFIVTIALLLIGVFVPMAIEEGMSSVEEYETWSGSLWKEVLDWCIVIGLIGLIIAIVVSLIFIRG